MRIRIQEAVSSDLDPKTLFKTRLYVYVVSDVTSAPDLRAQDQPSMEPGGSWRLFRSNSNFRIIIFCSCRNLVCVVLNSYGKFFWTEPFFFR